MICRLVLGDWSKDGHGESDEYWVESNLPLKEVQEAYREACRKTGVQFHHNYSNNLGDYSGGIPVFTEFGYGDTDVPPEAVRRLATVGVEVAEDSDAKDIILAFIQVGNPDLELKFLELPPAINGWWGDLNHGFGYGCYGH